MKHTFNTIIRTISLLLAGALVWGIGGNWLATTPRQAGQASAAALTVQSVAPLTAPNPAANPSDAARDHKASAPDAAVGTGFTYQGSLKTGGNPANGGYDFVFTLYDDLTGGNVVSSPLTQTNVTVTGGLFTVTLDFGQGAFNGDGRWLEIAVRQTGGGSYTTLSPRQAITPAPYAQFALKTQPYKNVVTVAQSGGQYTSITAALNSITDASSTNHYLVWIGPGIYTETVTMKQWVDIEGSGEEATKITFTGSSSINTGTVVGASNAELRFLTVENTGGNGFAGAIYNNSASPSLLHVTATAFGASGANYGVYNTSSSPNMSNVTSTASGGNFSYGVYNLLSSPNMSNVTATASGVGSNIGVANESSSPNMSNVTATASGGSGSSNFGVFNSSSSANMNNVTATASGGNFNFGVDNNSSSSPNMSNVTATASGGSGSTNYGVYNAVSSPRIVTSIISASGGTNKFGVYDVSSSGTVTIDNSKITGSTNTIFNGSGVTAQVGASQLAGGGVSNSGTLTCAGVYDENYVFYPNTCP